MTQEKNNNLEMFINELTELSKKYNLYVGACGCCGSPYIEEKPLSGVSIAHELVFCPKINKYEYKQ